MEEFKKFGEQLRQVLIGLLNTQDSKIEGISKNEFLGFADRFPTDGIDEIHPTTTMTINIFGRGQETIQFAGENVTLKIRRRNTDRRPDHNRKDHRECSGRTFPSAKLLRCAR